MQKLIYTYIHTYIHTYIYKYLNMHTMWFVAAVAVSAYHSFRGLDVCPPVQEDLDGPEMAFLSSPIEGSPSILSDDTNRDST
jgi:hypothetical protein